jgi:hypothetical protein
LDTSEPLGKGVIILFVGLGLVLLIGVGGAIYAIVKLTGGNDDGYEPIE